MTTLDLLTVICLMQSRKMLAFFVSWTRYWFCVQLGPTHSLLCKAVSKTYNAQHEPHMPDIPPQVQDFALLFVELYEVAVSTFLQSAEVPLDCCRALCISATPPSFVSSTNIVRLHFTLSSRSLIKVLNMIGPSIGPWDMLLVTALFFVVV